MKRFTRLLALSTCLFAPTTALFAETPPAPEVALARGLLMSHQGRLIFSPCRDRNYMDVSDTSANQVVSTAMSRLSQNGSPLYVEFYAVLSNGRLEVSGLNFAHTDARCHAPRSGTGWRAIGSQSPWQLDTFNAQARLTGADGSTQTTPVTVHELASGGSRMEADGSVKQTWLFEPKLCEIPGQGIVTGWSATGPAGPGCGWKP